MRLGTFLAAVVVLGPVLAAQAQSDLARFERQLETILRDTRLLAPPGVPIGQRMLFDVGGYTTAAFASIDAFDQKNHFLSQYEFNLFGKASIDGVHDFYASAVARYQDWEQGDSFDGRGDRWQLPPTVDRAYYRFDMQRAYAAYEGKEIPGNVVVEVGRQLIDWANGLTLSQVIDGGDVMLAYKGLELEGLAGVTYDRDIDIDSSRPGYEDRTNRGFFGGKVTLPRFLKQRPFVYGLVQQDYNRDQVLLFGPYTTHFNYNSYYIGAGTTGTIIGPWSYGLEAVYEGGDGLSNSFNPVTLVAVPQTRDDIQAWAADFKVTYAPEDVFHTRVEGEGILASGDRDRLTGTNTFAGNTAGTKDHGFNAFGLVNTGLAFNANVTNLMALRLGVSGFPLPKNSHFDHLRVGANVFGFGKLQGHAPIDEPTQSKQFLGVEADVYADWQILSDLSLILRYGAFWPGDAIATGRDIRNFVYMGLTYGF